MLQVGGSDTACRLAKMPGISRGRSRHFREGKAAIRCARDGDAAIREHDIAGSAFQAIRGHDSGSGRDLPRGVVDGGSRRRGTFGAGICAVTNP